MVLISSLFREYLVDVATHYVATMSGAVSLGIAFYNNVKGKLDERLFYIIAIFFFFFAGYQAWQDQRQQLDSTHLVGEIYNFVQGTRSDTGTTEVFIEAAIKNTGTPTIAEGYQLSIVGNGVDVRNASSTYIPEKLTIHNPDGSTWEFYGKDALYEKTNHPIPEGGMEVGWLRYEILGKVPYEKAKEWTWTVTFRDIRGKEYSASGSPGGRSQYHPGAGYPSIPKVPDNSRPR
jgi:hypothetical protein